jgi:hypothetical protein
MGKISYNSNVNFVAPQLNGFVGEIPIFVNLAIKNNVRAIMSQNILKISCQNVKDLENVQWAEIMVKMVNKKC